MRITPQTEEQIAEAGLWPEGIYSFEITEASEQTSKNGNEMIKLTLNVFNEEAHSRIVFDYLVDSIPHKVRHLAVASGLLNEYEAGVMSAHNLIGKCGKLFLMKKTDKNGEYPPQNAVRDYVKDVAILPASTGVITPHHQAKQNGYMPDNSGLDDEIPF